MQVERFQARTMKEALAQVKRHLGEDAVVLSTRTVRTRGKGLLGERVYEVAALPADPARDELAVEMDAAPIAPRHEPTLTPDDLDRIVAPLRQEVLSLRAQLRGINNEPLRRDLRRTIEELRATVGMVSVSSSESTRDGVRGRLERAGVGSVLASNLVTEARACLEEEASGEALEATEEQALLTAMVEQVIGRRLKIRPELPPAGARPRVVALVGPTGSGKTTTVAKLASVAALVDRRKVALITMDTYRIGGVEQLRRYATLIGVPFAVAGDGKSLREALLEHSDADLVLVDTPGRSPKQPGALDALAGAMTRADEPVQIQLVLPAATRLVELESTLAHYEGLEPECLIITKTDEAHGGGAVLESCVRTQLPVSFVCNGQRVPEDIAPANASRLAGFVLGLEEN